MDYQVSYIFLTRIYLEANVPSRMVAMRRVRKFKKILILFHRHYGLEGFVYHRRKGLVSVDSRPDFNVCLVYPNL